MLRPVQVQAARQAQAEQVPRPAMAGAELRRLQAPVREQDRLARQELQVQPERSKVVLPRLRSTLAAPVLVRTRASRQPPARTR